MITGTVKWFDDQKGYGFITPSDGSKEVFVHHTGINAQGFRTLAENEPVEFDVADTEKGRKAVNVKRLNAV